MITDNLKNYRYYLGVNRNLRKAFDFINCYLQKELPDGRYEIDGDDVYAMVQSYETKPETEKKWEAHIKYIDLQYVVKGNEIICWTNIQRLTPCTEYDHENDFTLFEGKEASAVRLEGGEFMILFPDDAHKPGCIRDVAQNIKKIVVKIIE